MDFFTILIAEDERRILKGIKDIVENSCPKINAVLSATNGKAALDIFAEYQPDIIITDICMPLMDGCDLVEKVREINADVPIIVLSALSDFETAKRMINCAILSYISKPFDQYDIIENVEKALEYLTKIKKQKHVYDIEKNDPGFFEALDKGEENNLVDGIQTIVKENYFDTLTLETLSEKLHVNSSYLSTLYKQKTGHNLSDYILAIRIKNAKRLLIETNYSITQIAEKVGYSTDKYFIKVFKDHVGITPNKYRNGLKI